MTSKFVQTYIFVLGIHLGIRFNANTVKLWRLLKAFICCSKPVLIQGHVDTRCLFFRGEPEFAYRRKGP